MGHKMLKTYLPAISMSFMVIILLAGVIKWILEKKQDIFVSFAFEVAAYLVVTCILDELIRQINFKSYLGHFMTESVLIYPVTIFFAVRFNWFAINAGNMVFYSVVYFLVMTGLHLYFYYMEKSSVEELNRLLDGRRDQNG